MTVDTLRGADALEAMLAIARAASRVVLRVYDAREFTVSMKGPGDPVTVADTEANALITEELARQFPGVPIVAEESPAESFAGFERSRCAFFVDPLDGTAEFVARNGEFAVMIGLAEEGAPSAGVVVCPVNGRAFVGAVGRGAFEVHPDGSRTPLALSAVGRLADASCVVSRSHRGAAVDQTLNLLGCKAIIPCGSAGIKAVRVATGEADIYVHPARAGMRWDTCAPEAIVRAAGGVLTDTRGQPYDYTDTQLANDGGCVCGNPTLHAEAVAALARSSG